MAVSDLNLVGLLDAFNGLFDFHTGGPRRAVFFDIDVTYPSLRAPVIALGLTGGYRRAAASRTG